MTAAALSNGTLLPRPPGGNGAGALLALLVHAALLAALTVSVDWRSQPVDVVAAELWASVPQQAAPPAPAPPPPQPPVVVEPPRVATPPPRVETPPREPDIATEPPKRRKPEPEKKEKAEEPPPVRKKTEVEKKPEPEKKPRDEAREAREAAALEKQLAEQREAHLRRIMGAAESVAGGRSGSASTDAAPSAAYAGRVAALIRRSSVFTGTVPGNPATEVEVRTSAGGTIMSARMVKSSGHKAWDDAVLLAIEKTGTLPRDVDGRVPSTIIINFRPKDE